MATNYTLGRGKIYFADFQTGTQIPSAFRYIGNTPSLSLTIDSEDLDHFSSDAGIREKDDSVAIEVTRTGQMEADDINVENLALFFFGAASTITVGASTGISFDLAAANVVLDRYYQIGVSESDPVGARGIVSGTFVLTGPAGTPVYTVVDDYTLDAATGMVYLVPTGAVVPGVAVEMTYDLAASTRDRVISGSSPRQGAMRFVAENPKGIDRDFIFPLAKITPNGDFSLKADEWQVIPFSLEFLKPTAAEAIYVDGRPV